MGPAQRVAGGFFTDTAGGDQPFLVTQSNGAWGSATLVPGMAALNATDLAHVSAVSCGNFTQADPIACSSAGNCVLGGEYQDPRFFDQAFVAGETGGTWHAAQAVFGIVAANAGAIAQTGPVSRVPGGKCTAAGFYSDHAGHLHAWVVHQLGG